MGHGVDDTSEPQNEDRATLRVGAWILGAVSLALWGGAVLALIGPAFSDAFSREWRQELMGLATLLSVPVSALWVRVSVQIALMNRDIGARARPPDRTDGHTVPTPRPASSSRTPPT